MYNVVLLNLKNGQQFTKSFSSPYLKDQFVKKCRYSKKVVVLGVFKEY